MIFNKRFFQYPNSRSNTHSQILNYSNPNLQIFKTQVIQSIIRALLFTLLLLHHHHHRTRQNFFSSTSFPLPLTATRTFFHILHSILAGFLLAISLPSTLSLANMIRNIASCLVISFF